MSADEDPVHQGTPPKRRKSSRASCASSAGTSNSWEKFAKDELARNMVLRDPFPSAPIKNKWIEEIMVKLADEYPGLSSEKAKDRFLNDPKVNKHLSNKRGNLVSKVKKMLTSSLQAIEIPDTDLPPGERNPLGKLRYC